MLHVAAGLHYNVSVAEKHQTIEELIQCVVETYGVCVCVCVCVVVFVCVLSSGCSPLSVAALI